MSIELWTSQFDQAQSLSEVETLLHRLTLDLGCQHFAAFSIIDAPGTPFVIESIDNAPAEYAGFFELSRGASDPVMQTVKHSSLPLVWDRSFYVDRDRKTMHDEQAEFGFKTGVCVALHMPNHRHFVLGVERDAATIGSQAEAAYLKNAIVMGALHAQSAIERIAPDYLQPQAKLAPRVIECLKWMIEGKTAWETSVILGISERTVAEHLNTATRVLDAANKHHAGIKAIRLGLIA